MDDLVQEVEVEVALSPWQVAEGEGHHFLEVVEDEDQSSCQMVLGAVEVLAGEAGGC